MVAHSKISRQIANAHILLRCGEKEHKEMCGELRDVLLENFNNVEEAYTTQAIVGKEDFCVAATAKINPQNLDKFKTDLLNLHVNKKPSSKVKAIKVDIEVV